MGTRETRSKYITVPVSPTEHRDVETASGDLGLSMASWIRMAIKRALGKTDA